MVCVERLIVIEAYAKPTRVVVKGKGEVVREVEVDWDASTKTIMVGIYHRRGKCGQEGGECSRVVKGKRLVDHDRGPC